MIIIIIIKIIGPIGAPMRPHGPPWAPPGPPWAAPWALGRAPAGAPRPFPSACCIFYKQLYL